MYETRVHISMKKLSNLRIQCQWLPFHDDVKINKCVSLYKALQGKSPMYIDNLLITNKSVHVERRDMDNTTLNAQSFDTSPRRSFSISSIKLWNSLPDNFKRINSLSSF